MKRTWMSRALLSAALLLVIGVLAACTATAPATPSGPATPAPSPMPATGKQMPVPTRPPVLTEAPAAAATTAPTAAVAPAAATTAPGVAAETAVTGTPGIIASPPLEGTLWKMVSYLNGQGQTVEALPGTDVTARFQDAKVSGTDGCNQYGGSYKTEGSVLTVKLGPSTMIACDPKIMDQGQAYAVALGGSATYQITGNQLQLTNGGNKIAVTFTVFEGLPLADTTWKVQSYNNGKGGIVSIADGTEITAIFGADGTLTGSAGCNDYSTTYQVVTDTLKISPAIATTRKMCPGPLMQQETAYLSALSTAATFKIEGTKLALRDADGATIANFSGAAAAQAAGSAPVIGASEAPTQTVTITASLATALSLEDTHWALVSLANARGGAFPPLPGTTITAQFQNGRVVGSAGCNNYSARYTVSDDKLAISAVVATARKACPQPVAQQEATYLAALRTVAGYQINLTTLELRNVTGDLVMSFAAPQPTPAPAAPTQAPTPTTAPTQAPAPVPTQAPTPTAAPVPTATPKAATAPIIDMVWKWIRFVSPAEATDVPAPDKYTAVFRADGQLAITADCNKATGTYKTVGSRIQVQLVPSTLAACQSDSLSAEFLQNLGQSTLYFLDDGNLYITLFADSGVMKFTNGGPAK